MNIDTYMVCKDHLALIQFLEIVLMVKETENSTGINTVFDRLGQEIQYVNEQGINYQSPVLNYIKKN
jgi:hypothetical protein